MSKKKSIYNPAITTRLPESLIKEINIEAARTGKKKQDLIAELIQRGLKKK